MPHATGIHPHAAQRALERGVTEAEIRTAVALGAQSPARFGRTAFRYDFPFHGTWRGRAYATKQVEVFAVRQGGTWLAITVIARYF